MERRSDRIREHRERAAERQVHEAEEQAAPPPRGRHNRGNRGHHNQRHGHEQPQEDNIPVIEVRKDGDEELSRMLEIIQYKDKNHCHPHQH